MEGIGGKDWGGGRGEGRGRENGEGRGKGGSWGNSALVLGRDRRPCCHLLSSTNGPYDTIRCNTIYRLQLITGRHLTV